MADSFPCPACGFLTFSAPPGSYEICDVCGWEDDHVQLAHPRMRGGAKQRDPGWRPVTDEEAAVREKAPRSGTEYFQAATEEEPAYYWRKPRPS